ncbi:MAG: DNA polymerase III subunit beta [Acetivibrionales bacterium]|jgi:DNA polymerase-3 subunit beta
MKVICSKENLINGINIAQKAVSPKSTLPILEGILLEAGEKFKLTGNDLEIGIECFIEADIINQGSIVLNSKIFGEIVRRLPDSEVLMELKENEMVLIDCENSHFEIKGLKADGFPSLPVIEKENALKISQKLIKEMIKQTIFAVSVDENRPILTGSLIECSSGQLTFVSIDGYRMALRKNNVSNETSDIKVVVPGKTLNEISKILQPSDEEVAIYNAANQILFDLGNCKIVSRLLEGEYLNYGNIIPKEYETKVKVRVKDILSSIERASLIITNEERRYPVRFNICDDNIIITSNTDVGAAKEEIRVEMDGKDLDIAFNPRYFIDCLRVIEDEFVEIFFTNNVGPCTVKPVEDDYFSYMVLPVRR